VAVENRIAKGEVPHGLNANPEPGSASRAASFEGISSGSRMVRLNAAGLGPPAQVVNRSRFAHRPCPLIQHALLFPKVRSEMEHETNGLWLRAGLDQGPIPGRPA
jgi:hypothetical protein